MTNITITRFLRSTNPKPDSGKSVTHIHEAHSPDLPKGWRLLVLSRQQFAEKSTLVGRARFLGLDFEQGVPVVSVWL